MHSSIPLCLLLSIIVSLLSSFLSSTVLFGAPHCLWQSSTVVASFVLALLPCKLCWVISQYSCSGGNSAFCFCSEACRHPSLTISLLKTPTALSVLSKPIAYVPYGRKGNHRKWHLSLTWVLNTILAFLFFSFFADCIPTSSSRHTAWRRHFSSAGTALTQSQEKVVVRESTEGERAVVKVRLHSLMWWAYCQSQISQKALSHSSHTHTLLLVFQTHSKMGNVPFRWKYNSKLNSVDFKVFINKLSWSFSIYAEPQRGRKSLNHDSWQI